MDIERRLIRNLDIPLIATTLALVAFGLVAVYSATFSLSADDPFAFVRRQLAWAAMGSVAAVALLLTDYRQWGRISRLIYLGTLAVLAAVPFLAPSIQGANRWLVLGPVQIQPSEFAKLAIIVTLARHLSAKESMDAPLDLVGPLLHVGLPMGLIILQPDLGTSLIFIIILFGMLFVAGTPGRYLAALALAGVGLFLLAAFVSSQGWIPIFKDYQLRRLFIFLNPYSDRTGDGWNVIQSMIAIGSGGFFGKGLFAGSQTQLRFLPARHTDFIFSVIGEELGFLGAVFLLGLYFLLLFRGIRLMGHAKDAFGVLIIAGVVSMMFGHILINVGMTLGVMPVTGLPLPFVSVGGTSLISSLMGVAMILNVHMRRHKIRF